MPLLLSGPPASGKTRAALDRFLSSADALLLVPTATMAEHLRHSLARQRLPVRPSRIQTVAAYLDEHCDLAAAPEPLLHLLLEQALARQRPERYAAVAGFPGFRNALAALFGEAPLGALPYDLESLFEEVRTGLGARGYAARNARLRSARPSHASHLVLDGFFTFSPSELHWLFHCGAEVTVTLPTWPGSQEARQALLDAGYEEESFAEPRRAPRPSGFSAATIEAEVEEIARRIGEEATEGRPFREMGVVLRSRDPYGSLLATTFARFHIPARFYYHDPLGAHPAIAYIASLVRAHLGGWDHAAVLAAIRMPISGIGGTPAGDALDFATRAHLPGAGEPLPHPIVADFRDLKSLRRLIPAPQPHDNATPAQIYVWRSTAAALSAFGEVVDAAAAALPDAPMPALWRHIETALAIEPLRVPDARRDVVHVMDAHEARQWELPIVFVCGLTERHFPQYHREDPILGDAAREGLGLATAAHRQIEERFLFDLATSRATQETVLSYPRFDESGEETLPSFFLSAPLPSAAAVSLSVEAPPRPPSVPFAGAPPATLSPTAVESFLQCPFQYFARYTLALNQRPPAPRDRLDALMQGSIVHRALAEWTEAPILGETAFDAAFEDACRRHNIPMTYRTEAVRLAMKRSFLDFIADRQFTLGPAWSTRVEEKFEIALNPTLTVRGRIDRLNTADRRAIVTDYKFSAQIKDRIKANSEGRAVQAGLYLLAAERFFKLKPAGVFLCGLKKGIQWDGWHLPIPGLETLGENCVPDVLHDLARSAEQATLGAHEAMAQGRIAPQPADTSKCAWCDFSAICRIEVATPVKESAAT